MTLTKWYLLGLACTLVLGGTVATSAADDAAEAIMSSQQISDHVEDELLFDAAVMAAQVDVDTTDGVVTLTGLVDSLLEKERAGKLAQAVKGVEAVVNRLQVSPAAIQTDDEIVSDVVDALAVDPATESYEVDVGCVGGNVTLAGTVDSWQEKQLVAQVAKGVSGVTDLTNQVQVEYTSNRTDSEIEKEVRKALDWNVYIDMGSTIDVEVNNGTVTLEGVVGSAAERREAVSLAWVNGVEDVNVDELDIETWAQVEHKRDPKYPTRGDSEIVLAVENALRHDPRVNSFDVDVSSVLGRIVLRGKVSNLKAKQSAEQTANSVYGVTEVDNRLKVRLESIPENAVLKARVNSAFFRNPYVQSYEIEVTVNNGIVTLDGDVDSFFEKSQAESLASSVDGVSYVINDLLVDSDVDSYVYDPLVDDYDPAYYDWYTYQNTPTIRTKSDAEILEDIESEMGWSPFVDVDEVNISVEDGTATLTGTVQSSSERLSATENAFEGGAISVVNNIVIE